MDIMNYEESSDETDTPEEEGRLNVKKFENKRDAVIYLLDSRKKMFMKDDSIENKIPFIQCLNCIRNAIRAKIRVSKKALCALILLGTKKTENSLNLNGITMIENLKSLSAEYILKIDEIITKVDGSCFEKEYGWGSFSLPDALWLCCKIFADSTKTMKLNKTIILFTNDDNPSGNDRNEFNRIISHGRDLVESKIVFDLIYLGENINCNKLYKELIQMSRGHMDYQIPKPDKKMEEMVRRTNKMDYRHVTLARIPFYITDSFKCEVSIHYLTRKVKPPFKVKLSKATNDIVITKSQYFETETGEVVSKENLVKVYQIGGKEIPFTMEELEHIESFSEKGLRLLGFKPSSSVTEEHFVQPCAFIYPSDPEDLEGSTFFVALLMRCLEKDVVPICTFCPRGGSSVRYVALKAMEEELATDRTQICPDGFIVFFLPFQEEVRDLSDKCPIEEEPSTEAVDAAKNLIKKLRIDYSPEKFQNPRLASHWAAVEALALNLKEPELIVDTTAPDEELQYERTKDVADKFREIVRRDVKNSTSKQAPSKVAKQASVVEINEADVEKAIKDGRGTGFPNSVLKLYLEKVGKGQGLSKMKKSDLLRRIHEHLNLPMP